MKPRLLLSAKKISKTYKHPYPSNILKQISFDLHENESIAIVGPSGVGKSTLLHILGTLEKPSAGTLEIMGQSIFFPNAHLIRNRHIGFIFQNFNLLEEYSVLENVLLPAKIGGYPTGKNRPVFHQAEKLLEKVGLSSHKHHFAKLLSGGEKQRVCIARAFCNNPDVILADEPSGDLDQANSKMIHELLLNFTRNLNKGLMIVTHNMDLAKLCEKQYQLLEGHLTSI